MFLELISTAAVTISHRTGAMRSHIVFAEEPVKQVRSMTAMPTRLADDNSIINGI